MTVEVQMTRRDFIISMAALAMGAAIKPALGKQMNISQSPSIMTVTGPMSRLSAGVVLPHEHILVDFIGADRVSKNRYDLNDVYDVVLPYLKDAYNLGCRTFVDCTADYLGRDPALLRRLSIGSKLRIVTNTGFYGASDGRYVPAFAIDSDAVSLADLWTSEFERGIDGTNVRPGFIKIGVNPDPSPLDMKLVKAAGLTHLRTGLTIASHTVTGAAAREQIEMLMSLGVHPSAFIWVHAQAEPDIGCHTWAASKGAWVEYDGLSPQSVDQHLKLVKGMMESGLLHRVLISHDAGWYNVGDVGGGAFRPFDTLFKQLVPAMKGDGIPQHAIRQITQTNPSRAFSIYVRKLCT